MLRSVAALALPGVSPFEFGVLCEVFGIDRSDMGGPALDFRIVTDRPGMVPMSIGVPILVDRGLEDAADADLIAVPPVKRDFVFPEPVLQLLRDAVDRGAWVFSVCSGAFLLGAAGLLDGRRCTTHWIYSDRLAREYPAAIVDPDVLYVEDGPVVTSAGTAAGIDAALHLVRRELGGAAAGVIARRMVVPPHRSGGQAQYVKDPLPGDAQTLAPLLEWIQQNLHEELTVPVLARRSHMSERTFARRFRSETGTTPAHWVNRQRVLRAQELLEQTSLSVEEVARQCGFGSSAVLRHAFARSLGTSPLAYKRAFAGPASA